MGRVSGWVTLFVQADGRGPTEIVKYSQLLEYTFQIYAPPLFADLIVNTLILIFV